MTVKIKTGRKKAVRTCVQEPFRSILAETDENNRFLFYLRLFFEYTVL
jgi:hypothetical protein